MAQNGILKVAVIGAESTGKTWLCEALAAHYKTLWVPEFAREYFNDSDIYNYTLEDLEHIAEKQVELENTYIKEAGDILFCDTGLITLKIWAELEFNVCPQRILDLMKTGTYDYYLITNNDIPWMKDPLRQNKHSRDLIFQMNVAEVQKTKTAHEIIKGKNDLRLNAAIQAIEKRFKLI